LRKSCRLFLINVKDIVEQASSKMTIYSMHIACWILKVTNTRARARAHTHTHTNTQVVQYSLLFHSNNGWTGAPQCVLLKFTPWSLVKRKAL